MDSMPSMPPCSMTSHPLGGGSGGGGGGEGTLGMTSPHSMTSSMMSSIHHHQSASQISPIYSHTPPNMHNHHPMQVSNSKLLMTSYDTFD